MRLQPSLYDKQNKHLKWEWLEEIDKSTQE